MIVFVSRSKVDPLAVEWYADGKVIYTVGSNIKVGTMRSAKIARRTASAHNASLAS